MNLIGGEENGRRKRNERKKRRRKRSERSGVPSIVILLVMVLVVTIVVFLLTKIFSIPSLFSWIFEMIVVGLLMISTIRRIPFPEYWIVDRKGRLIEKKPGYCIFIWFFGFEKVYAKVKSKIQYSIALFPEEKETWIDLKIGGKLKLSDPRIWIRVKEPLKTVTESLNFEEQIREIAEHRITGYLNTLEPEEVMKMKGPRLQEEGKREIEVKIDEVLKKSPEFQEFLEKVYVELVGFTLDDFDFDPTLTKKREERITTEMEKGIAENRSEARKNELSAIRKIAEVLQDAGFPSSKAQDIASERYQDHLVAEKGTLQKIIWQGGGNIPQIAAQWEMGKRMPIDKEKPKTKLQEEKEEKSEYHKRIREEERRKTEEKLKKLKK